MSSWMIDGRWYVGVVATGFEALVFGDRGQAPADDVLPADVTTDGAWRLLFVEPPDDVGLVMTNDSAGSGAFIGLTRPD